MNTHKPQSVSTKSTKLLILEPRPRIPVDESPAHHLLMLREFLAKRYRERSNLNVVELGPHTTTIVAKTMAPFMAAYVGVEKSIRVVSQQIEHFRQIPNASIIWDDSRSLSMADKSVDVVVASCHPALLSGSVESMRDAHAEVSRVLRDDGDLILLPWTEAYEQDQDPNRKHFAPFELYRAAAPFEFFMPDDIAFCSGSISPPTFILALRKHEMPDLKYEIYNTVEKQTRAIVDNIIQFPPNQEVYHGNDLRHWKQHRPTNTLDYRAS